MSFLPSHQQLRQATRTLHQGGIISYPTEAVFGLGCDPLNPDAVYRLLALKQRDIHKGLILIAADLEQLQPYLLPFNGAMAKRVTGRWPGPVTWLLPARPDCPDWLTGGRDSLAVRVSAHPVCRALCQHWQGALVSTSANISGHAAIRQPLQLHKQFGTKIDFLLPGELGAHRQPTEIRDAKNGHQLRA